MKKLKKAFAGISLRRIVLASAICLTFLFTTGCTFSTSIDTLLTPPKLTKQQEQIYNALTDSVGSNITLQYPKTGENLSAFIVSDLDGDGEDEAIVFYKKNSAAGADELRINVLDVSNEKWKSVYDAATDGTEVEKINVKKLGAADTTCIIAGYSYVNGTGKSLVVYKYNDSSLNLTFRTSYNYSFVDDFDNDKKNEIFVIQNMSGADETSKAVYYEFDMAGLTPNPIELSISELASDVTQVLFGNETNGSTGVYIDEVVGTSVIQTEIFNISKNTMIKSDEDVTVTQRQQELASCDIDGDNCIEIPVKSDLFPGYTEGDTGSIYETAWLTDSENTYKEKYTGYYNVGSGYVFVLPTAWKNKVTCVYDTEKEETVFYRFNTSLEQSKSALLYIASGKNQSEMTELCSDGYTDINEKLGMHTLLYVPESDDSLIKKIELIEGNMFFIS